MKYQVKVDGKVYEVEVEKIGGGGYQPLTANAFTQPAAPAPQPAAPTPAPAPAPAPKAAPAPAAAPKAASGAGEEVVSPMPGNVLSVNVKTGDSVSTGDVILILEAMKMENEIVAPCDGTVTVNVSAGQTVDTDEVLATVE